ncbi:MAG: VWA domain-containing protein [Acidobacteriota bacterium]
MQRHSRVWVFSLVLLAGCPCIAAYLQSQTSQNIPTFSVSVDLIKVPITVIGENGAPVQDLQRNDFHVYEDGKLQQIRSFNVDANPVSIILLLDSSGTVEKEWKQIRESAEGFADALVHGDRISVITFADDVEKVLDWTPDTSQVRKVLKKIQLGLRTDLYDAMLEAAQDQLKGIDGRMAIILLTDFLNNQSVVGYQDAVRAVIQSQATLYIISKTAMVREAARVQPHVVILNDIYARIFGDANYIDEFFAKKEEQMSDLAEKTGGRCYFPADYNQIHGVYQQVAKELRNQYYLTYVSEQNKDPNSYHSITVEYLQPSKKLVYRKGYYFKPDPIFEPHQPIRTYKKH